MVFGGFSWFLRWFWWSTARNHRKTKKHHEFLLLERWFENCVCFFFLGFCGGFGGLSWLLVVFLGFYSGFRLLVVFCEFYNRFGG